MKNAAARVAFPFLLALLSVSMAIPACAAYEKCVKPEITAATKLAPADLLKEVSAFLLCGGPDLPDLAAPCAVKGLADLAIAIGPGGEEAVNCLVSYLEGNSTDAVLKARAKAVGAKRGVTEELFNAHACNGIKPAVVAAQDSAGAWRGTTASVSSGRWSVQGPPALSQPGGEPSAFRSSGEVPARLLSHAACDHACGASLTGLATSTGCSCWRADRTSWRNSRWVALADRSPPAVGAGVVGGGGV